MLLESDESTVQTKEPVRHEIHGGAVIGKRRHKQYDRKRVIKLVC